jgi:hypothetical protein
MPDTTLTATPLASSTSSTANFTFICGETATFEASLDSGAYVSVTSPATYTNLSDGSHTFNVRATDSAGNIDPSPASYSWTIDTTAISLNKYALAKRHLSEIAAPPLLIFSGSGRIL